MSDRPALSNHALRETLDLLGEVVASMAQKLDAQDETRSEVTRLLLGSLDTLLDDVDATKAQTDPAGYARHIGARGRGRPRPRAQPARGAAGRLRD